MSNVNAHPVAKTAIFLQIDGISCASIYDAEYNTSKSIVRVTTIKIAVNDFFHIRPEKSILPLKLFLIDLLESLKMILNTAIIC